jgi:hypothetical protein
MAANSLPAKLYHGTRSGVLAAVARDGLRPRGTNGRGNWDHTVPSNESAVYLTVSYGLYFARSAQSDGTPTILEIDTARLRAELLVADEDGLALTEQSSGTHGNAEYWREEIHKVPAFRTLESLGNCAYLGVIPPEAISRVLILNEAEALRLTLQACDPVIAPVNFLLFGEEYVAFTQWLFNRDASYTAGGRVVERPEAAALPLSYFAGTVA